MSNWTFTPHDTIDDLQCLNGQVVAIILAMLLVTAVIVLVEHHRDRHRITHLSTNLDRHYTTTPREDHNK